MTGRSRRQHSSNKMRYEIRLKLDEALHDLNGLAVIGHEWARRIAACAEHFSQIPEAATPYVLNDIHMKAAEAAANGLPIEKKRLFWESATVYSHLHRQLKSAQRWIWGKTTVCTDMHNAENGN